MYGLCLRRFKNGNILGGRLSIREGPSSPKQVEIHLKGWREFQCFFITKLILHFTPGDASQRKGLLLPQEHGRSRMVMDGGTDDGLSENK